MSETLDTRLIPVKAAVNMDDVVSVRVAEVDSKLEQRISEQREVVKVAKTAVETAQKAVAPVVEAEIAAACKALVAKINAGLKAAGLKAQARQAGNSGVKDYNKFTLVYGIGFSTDKQSHVSPVEIIEFPSTKAKVVMQAANDATEEFKKQNAELLKLLDAKTKMGTFERVCRAKVAENRLSQTQEGREILAQLRAEDANKLLALPSGTV